MPLASYKLAWNAALFAPDDRPIYAWAEDNVKLPASAYAISDTFHVAKSRYLCEPLDALANDRVREVTVVAGVQTGKSLIADLFVLHVICLNPGPVIWNFPTNDKAIDYAKRRTTPLFKNVKGIPWPKDKYDVTRAEILFPSMWMALQGANETNLQTHSVPYVINDEVWQFEPGMLAQARARATYFRWRSKVLNVSQAGDAGEDLDLAFRAGHQAQWCVPCPACNRYQAMEWFHHRPDGTWAGFRWDDTPITRPNGAWDFNALRPTIRYECVHCGSVIRDTPAERRRLNDLGRYDATNPNAPTEFRSFHWASWDCDEIPWSLLVEEYLRAKVEAEKGNPLPLRDWWRQRAGIPFDPEAHATTVDIPEVTLKAAWEKTKFTFITVDVQIRSLWMLVQSWAEDGESMTLWAGEVGGWEDVAAKQKEHGVPDQCVFVDSGYRRENAVNQSEVYLQCLRHGHEENRVWRSWTALKGTDARDFKYLIPSGHNKGKTISLMFQWPPTDRPVDIGLKTTDSQLQAVLAWQRKHGRRAYVREILWSSQLKHVGKARRDRMAKGELAYVAKGISQDFTKQMYSEQFVQRWDKLGQPSWVWERIGRRPNHLWDCWNMQIVAASMAGIIGEKIA